MAVSKAWTIKTGVKASVDYVANKDKTGVMNYIKNETKTIYGDKILVSGWQCNPETADMEFKMRENAYHNVKKENIAKGVKPNVAIHIIQSFSAKDSASMTPDQLHQYGMEFAGRICGEHFQAVVASHLNHSDQLHNHIVINAYARDGVYKFIEDRACVKRIREINDEICAEYGLEIVIPGKMDKVANYKEWQEKQNGTSWKAAVKEDIKSVSEATDNWYDFKTYLENAGYTIKENKRSVSYKAPGCPYAVSDVKLGAAYERDALMEMWRTRDIDEDREYITNVKPVNKEKTDDVPVESVDKNGRQRSKIEILLIKVIKKLKYMLSVGIKGKDDSDLAVFGRTEWKIQNMLDTLALVKENQIQSQEDLSERIHQVGSERNALRNKLDGDNINIQNMEQTVQDISDFLELEEIVDNIEIDGNLLNVEMPDAEEIRTARAEQDPMTKRQKMELFKLMEKETEFKLDYKFNQITRIEASDIILFLKDKTREQPAIVITAEEFNQKREAAKQNAIDGHKRSNNDAKLEKMPASIKQKALIQNLLKKHPEIQLKREITSQKDAIQVLDYFKNGGDYPDAFVSTRDVEIEKLNPDDRMTVQGYLDLKNKLYRLGLTDMESIRAYKEELKEKINTFAQEKEQFKALGREYAKFKRMEYNVELAKNPAYAATEKKIEQQNLCPDSDIDKEVEQVRQENKGYRAEDKHFHYEEER